MLTYVDISVSICTYSITRINMPQERLSLIPLSLQSGSVPFNWSMTGQIYAYFVLILAGVAAAISMAQML